MTSDVIKLTLVRIVAETYKNLTGLLPIVMISFIELPQAKLIETNLFLKRKLS